MCTLVNFLGQDGIQRAVWGGSYGSSSAGMVPGHPICGGWESTLDECYIQTSYQQCYNSDVGVNCDSGEYPHLGLHLSLPNCISFVAKILKKMKWG